MVQLAAGLVGAVEGGYPLAQISRDVTPIAPTIDMAKAHLQQLDCDLVEAP